MKPTPAVNGCARIAKLNLDLIRTDSGTQTRAHIDEVNNRIEHRL